MSQILSTLRLTDILDIVLVSMMVYYVLQWLKGSRAFQLLKGLLLLVALFIFSKLLGLTTIEWLLQKMSAIILIVFIVVFQPELRRGLERLGRHMFLLSFFWEPRAQDLSIITRLTKAVEVLAEKRIGALIIVERTTGLSEYAESGTVIDAQLVPELLIAIFNTRSPLHDGAVIIQNERIAAASCLLPISEVNFVNQKLGTRHRAALGISEISDAVVIVVSEETGGISIAENGILNRYPNKESFNARLLEIFKRVESK